MHTSTHPRPGADPACPIYTIETIALLFGVKVDTAREYTYRSDFPAPRALGARNLWTRAEVLAWFDELPRRQRETTGATAPGSQTAAAAVSRSSGYTPRNRRRAG